MENHVITDQGVSSRNAPGFVTCPAYKMALSPSADLHQVIFNEAVLAASNRAIVVREQNMHPVIYFPQADVDMALFAPTDHQTHCPFKGTASYWLINANGKGVENAAWSYSNPYAEANAVKGHIAFYLDKMICYWRNGEEQSLKSPGVCVTAPNEGIRCDELQVA